MFKKPAKSKKGPWVPPPGRSKKADKSPSKHPESDSTQLLNILKYSRKSDDDALEVLSLSSSLSANENQEESKLYLHNVKQEQRVLSLYFMSLRPISQFLNRFFSNADIQDTTIKKLLSKIEEQLNSLVICFEDLEYSLSLFENTVSGDSNSEDLSKIVKLKEGLLLKLLGCYTDILTAFQVALEDQCVNDTTKQERERDTFKKQLQTYEKKNLSQAATIKDLERRLSIMQGKYSAVESYNTTLEETKAELQKVLHYKDVQLRNVTSENHHISSKQNDERLIELIEEIKAKAQAEKTALKKALKAQKMQIEQKDQLLKKLEVDISEKVKMLFELAAQRDKLKVQMTVANNEIVQAKYQVEEIKSQKLKLQNDLSECEVTFRNKLQEATDALKNQLTEAVEENLNVKKTLRRLEEELSTTVKELQSLKSSHSNMETALSQTQTDKNEKAFEEVRSLISLLQDTQECIKTIKYPDIAAKGDSVQTEINPNNENILAVVQDIKKQILELKRPNSSGSNSAKTSKTELLSRLEEYELLHKTLSEENAILKSRIEELKNTSSAEQVPTFENYTSTNVGSDFTSKNLQMELMLKTEEIWRIRQREKKLECQLEEVKNKLQKKEMENCRLFTLEEALKRNEEELKAKKMELSLLEQKKHEESERLLHRTKELQEALDEMTANYESLQRYVDMLKSSLYNVFGDS